MNMIYPNRNGFRDFKERLIAMHYNCLIIDDETELAKMTCEYFQMFEVSCAYRGTAKEGLSFLREHTVDILLLDINLEQESGFSLCRQIREFSDMPILFISARQSDDDVLVALNIGGDDYIKKPYALSVLLAKIKVMLKRMAGTTQTERMQGEKKQPGFFLLEKSVMCVYVEGRKIPLKAKEFALLEYLFSHRNTIVTKQELFENVWGDGFFSDSTLNVHIRRLREKIEKNPNEPERIKTIWGTGYMLELEDE